MTKREEETLYLCLCVCMSVCVCDGRRERERREKRVGKGLSNCAPFSPVCIYRAVSARGRSHSKCLMSKVWEDKVTITTTPPLKEDGGEWVCSKVGFIPTLPRVHSVSHPHAHTHLA